MPGITPKEHEECLRVSNAWTVVYLAMVDLNPNQVVLIDYLDGESGDDQLHGGPNPDFMNGGFGSDTIYYSPGADIIQGGTDPNLKNDDKFVLDATSLDDRIIIHYDAARQAVLVDINKDRKSVV